MYKSIYDVKLKDLMPPGMTDDPKIIAESAALDTAHSFTIQAIKGAYILANIDQQDDDVTDMLAIQQHVDYYNQSLPLTTRRKLVKNSGFLHKIKGTPGAVEQVARIVFGSAQVQEWYEYGGDPYHFRVLINEFPDSDNQMGEVRRAIESSKNARSYLDDVIIVASTAKAPLYIAGCIQMAVYVNVKQQHK